MFTTKGAPTSFHIKKNKTVCTSAGWDDIIVFILVNYAAHGMTVVRFPGESSFEINGRRIDSLMAPFIVGLMYSLRKIQWVLILERDPLRRACRGGSLCQVVRTSTWRPQPGTVLEAEIFQLGRCRSDNGEREYVVPQLSSNHPIDIDEYQRDFQRSKKSVPSLF